jgi:hypothetical protein
MDMDDLVAQNVCGFKCITLLSKALTLLVHLLMNLAPVPTKNSILLLNDGSLGVYLARPQKTGSTLLPNSNSGDNSLMTLRIVLIYSCEESRTGFEQRSVGVLLPSTVNLNSPMSKTLSFFEDCV